jgi:hypothetical protein
LLLPYLEQHPLFRSLDVEFDIHRAPFHRQWWLTPAGLHPNVVNYTAAQQRLRIFQCPADPGTEAREAVLGYHFYNREDNGRHFLTYSAWVGDNVPPPASVVRFRAVGRTNYAGSGGGGRGTSPHWSRFEGILSNRSQHTPAQVAGWDGTSNTLLYGETSGRRAWWGDATTVQNSWVGTGALTTAFGVNRGPHAFFDALSSHHRLGVQVGMADSAVRLIRFGPWHGRGGLADGDWLLMMQLAGMRDGLSTDLTGILE